MGSGVADQLALAKENGALEWDANRKWDQQVAFEANRGALSGNTVANQLALAKANGALEWDANRKWDQQVALEANRGAFSGVAAGLEFWGNENALAGLEWDQHHESVPLGALSKKEMKVHLCHDNQYHMSFKNESYAISQMCKSGNFSQDVTRYRTDATSGRDVVYMDLTLSIPGFKTNECVDTAADFDCIQAHRDSSICMSESFRHKCNASCGCQATNIDVTNDWKLDYRVIEPKASEEKNRCYPSIGHSRDNVSGEPVGDISIHMLMKQKDEKECNFDKMVLELFVVGEDFADYESLDESNKITVTII